MSINAGLSFSKEYGSEAETKIVITCTFPTDCYWKCLGVGYAECVDGKCICHYADEVDIRYATAPSWQYIMHI